VAGGWIRSLCSGVLLTLAVVGLNAGGWVVITVTNVPDHVVVGEPFTLTYAVRQHGMHLLGGLTGRIEARAGATVVRAAAVRASAPGHYSATLLFPRTGDWTIEIFSGFSGPLSGSRITWQVIEPDRPAPAVSEPERGRRLFVAKGCVTCHAHGAVESRRSRTLADARPGASRQGHRVAGGLHQR
jgi:hypothetical protein